MANTSCRPIPFKLPAILYSLLWFTISSHIARTQHRPFEGNISATWSQCIQHYTKLDSQYEEAYLDRIGHSDGGKPLHLFIMNKDKQFYPELMDRSKTIILVNNAIHPGEPDGVDACMQWCSEVLDPANPLHALLDRVIICIIPMYNVDGALNRSPWSRANQEGPEEYGFRGNARNLDLNRDFIKCDSENALAFSRLFRRLDPDVLVDTHVSNGADYTYTMTLITTQPDKLGGELGTYLRQQMNPSLYKAMKERGHEMVPYVNTMGTLPQSGLADFLESPRFATGYAALWSTLGFTTETHMLKPFAQRVESTYQFLSVLATYCFAHGTEIQKMRNAAKAQLMAQKEFHLSWSLDTTRNEKIRFSGYEAETQTAAVGSGERLFYNRSKPATYEIAHYNRYRGSQTVRCPKAYIVPQAWKQAVERLRANGVLMKRLEHDTIIEVTATYIEDFKSPAKPYEGHYNHTGIKIRIERQRIAFFEGDYLINTSQAARRYLVEVLEPQGEDSFFAWNFFDSAMQQKEWFSDYVFEEKAAALLEADASLKNEFDTLMAADEQFRQNHWQQLYWIYKRSPYYERSAFRYPVFRVE